MLATNRILSVKTFVVADMSSLALTLESTWMSNSARAFAMTSLATMYVSVLKGNNDDIWTLNDSKMSSLTTNLLQCLGDK